MEYTKGSPPPRPLPEAVRKNPRLAAEVRVYDALTASLPEGCAGYHGEAFLLFCGSNGADVTAEANQATVSP